MLTGEAAAVGGDQRRGVLHEGAEGGDPGVRLEVEADPQVHAALTEVTEGDAPQPVSLHQSVEVTQVVGEVLRRDGGILPVRPGFAAVGEPGDSARGGFSDLPQSAHLGRVGDHDMVDGLHGGRHLLGDYLRSLRSVSGGLAVEPTTGALSQTNAREIGSGLRLALLAAQGIQQVTTHALDGGHTR